MLHSATRVGGPVRVAIYPWEIALVAPETATLTDRVISLRDERGARLVRLQRLVVRIAGGDGGDPAVSEGALVGLRVAAEHVRLLDA